MWRDGKSDDISIQEVLDFLRTAYHVHEAVEGADVRVDWDALSNSPLLSKLKDKNFDKEEPCEIPIAEEHVRVRRCNSLDVGRRKDGNDFLLRQGSVDKNSDKRSIDTRKYTNRRRSSLTTRKDTNLESGAKTAERYIKRKLNQVLQEGILDSVLPYILSRQQQTSRKTLTSSTSSVHDCANVEVKKPVCDNQEKIERIMPAPTKKDGRRRSTSFNDGKGPEKKDVEVVIHVCDEVKNIRKDFKCSQTLLLSHMKYFAEVTTGQRLEDMDISVHCDISIFDWLIRWVKQEGSPTLDSLIVMPVLMSSAFLQMEVLQDLCLEFCKSHINEIIRDSTNLGCVNESVLTRLANLFSNTEVEAMKDRKDKLLSKLYCKFIMFLAEPIPVERRGHYCSLAQLFRCIKCGNLIIHAYSTQTYCIPRNLRMDEGGQILSHHHRDPSWSLNDLIRNLKLELKTWRRVYWRLWGTCHYLRCSLCTSAYPIYHTSWCSHHYEAPQFFSMEHQRGMSFPVGRFPCCGDRAFRFEVLPLHSGCGFRDHVPKIVSENDQSIFKIYKQHRDLIRLEPGGDYEEKNSNGGPNKESLWWEGLELAPPKSRQGLLGNFLESVTKQQEKRFSGDQRHVRVPSTPTPSVLEVSSCSESSDPESSGTGGESEESFHATVRVTAKPRGAALAHHNLLPTRKDGGRAWVSKLSTRCNQDNQREFEEKTIRQMELLLTKKTTGESIGNGGRSFSYHDPPGGTYVRMEAEWREAHCSSHGCPGSSKVRLASSSRPKSKRNNINKNWEDSQDHSKIALCEEPTPWKSPFSTRPFVVWSKEEKAGRKQRISNRKHKPYRTN